MANKKAASDASLPAQFAELEQFSEWIIPRERERHLKRIASGIDDIQRFYDAILPRMDEIMGVLKEYPIDSVPPPEVRKLYFLAFSFIEVSHPIELRWGATNNAGAFLSTRLEIPDRK
ncbi:MAG TPA: hypothetical protein VNE82_10475 [Candidatus Binataceae bacterium]|nr:hypothetical protein [Candidatus Binataceae bacterium]HVB80350.1 hypothetical protein [Candidatus Binataceae bacterium]